MGHSKIHMQLYLIMLNDDWWRRLKSSRHYLWAQGFDSLTRLAICEWPLTNVICCYYPFGKSSWLTCKVDPILRPICFYHHCSPARSLPIRIFSTGTVQLHGSLLYIYIYFHVLYNLFLYFLKPFLLMIIDGSRNRKHTAAYGIRSYYCMFPSFGKGEGSLG